MASLLALLAVGGGVVYIARLAPRVAQRVSATTPTAATCATSGRLRYRQFESAFPAGTLGEKDAMRLLGFDEQRVAAALLPSDQEVKAKYRHLMMTMHSDVDGSSYVAMKINEARDVLLRKR